MQISCLYYNLEAYECKLEYYAQKVESLKKDQKTILSSAKTHLHSRMVTYELNITN